MLKNPPTLAIGGVDTTENELTNLVEGSLSSKKYANFHHMFCFKSKCYFPFLSKSELTFLANLNNNRALGVPSPAPAADKFQGSFLALESRNT